MKILIFFVFLPCFFIAQNNPPAGYLTKDIIVEDTDHVYLNLNTNTVTVKNQSGWDIALYNEVHEIGGKFNETKGVKLWRVFKDTTQFSSLTLADTLFSVNNNSSIFYYGGLDTMYTGTLTTSFNIGIGLFYQDNLVTVPTKMYIIKREDGGFGKFFISYKSAGGRNFIIRYSDINNSNSNYIAVPKVVPLARHYRYVKLSDASIQNDFEPLYNDWDLVFSKYNTGLQSFPIGVLTNNAHNLIRLSNITGFPSDYLKEGVVNTEAYEAIGDPSTVVYNNSLNSSEPISRNFDQIGAKWFNTSNNQPFSGRSYFLKDRNNKLWHIVFTSYNASSKTLSIAYSQKGSISSIASKNSIGENFLVYQNNTKLYIESIDSDKESRFQVTDIAGKILYKGFLKDKVQLDIYPYINKVLIVQIDNNAGLYHSKIFVY